MWKVGCEPLQFHKIMACTMHIVRYCIIISIDWICISIFFGEKRYIFVKFNFDEWTWLFYLIAVLCQLFAEPTPAIILSIHVHRPQVLFPMYFRLQNSSVSYWHRCWWKCLNRLYCFVLHKTNNNKHCYFKFHEVFVCCG